MSYQQKGTLGSLSGHNVEIFTSNHKILVTGKLLFGNYPGVAKVETYQKHLIVVILGPGMYLKDLGKINEE